jgi:hypothetical protein
MIAFQRKTLLAFSFVVGSLQPVSSAESSEFVILLQNKTLAAAEWAVQVTRETLLKCSEIIRCRRGVPVRAISPEYNARYEVVPNRDFSYFRCEPFSQDLF